MWMALYHNGGSQLLSLLDLLDMQLNNLHRIPPGFLCPLKNLRHIQLSYNAIKDLNDLGLGHDKGNFIQKDVFVYKMSTNFF